MLFEKINQPEEPVAASTMLSQFNLAQNDYRLPGYKFNVLADTDYVRQIKLINF